MILQMRGISSCLEFSLRCSLYRPSGQNRRRRRNQSGLAGTRRLAGRTRYPRSADGHLGKSRAVHIDVKDD